jgi:hypothetical protein
MWEYNILLPLHYLTNSLPYYFFFFIIPIHFSLLWNQFPIPTSFCLIIDSLINTPYTSYKIQLACILYTS